MSREDMSNEIENLLSTYTHTFVNFRGTWSSGIFTNLNKITNTIINIIPITQAKTKLTIIEIVDFASRWTERTTNVVALAVAIAVSF